jgi:serine/threonine protein kinase
VDVFISHASEDKDDVVRPLAEALKREGFDVWYDEYVLELGDSIRQKIDQGLAKCRFGIVVLSTHFFSKGWPQSELNALVSREMSKGEKVVLPVWHGVTHDDVAKNSPILADKLGVSTDRGLGVVVTEIISVLRRGRQTAAPSDPLSQYEILYTVHEGHFGKVLKCRSKETGELCVLKHSSNRQVSLETLEALSRLHISNLATPRKVWQTGDTTYEELPYVGGLRLSQAVFPALGGLTGSVLESFHDQMMATLGELHSAGIVHRDVHPENIYMVVERESEPIKVREAPRLQWHFDPFGIEAMPAEIVHRHPEFFGVGGRFRIAWVLVDCTFASLISSPSKTSFRHGSFTPEEQELGKPTAASDMYAFGATLYYSITGKELPPFRERKAKPVTPAVFPRGGHPSYSFPRHLELLVALNASERPSTPTVLGSDTVTQGYTGTLRVGEGLFLLCDHYSSHTVQANTQKALEMLRSMYDSPFYKDWRADLKKWIDVLR